jgi:hypothetical protein
MRYSVTVITLAGALAIAPLSNAQSSFGPEISAEDFDQHLWALRSPSFAGPGDAVFAGGFTDIYLQTQYERLGLGTQAFSCSGKIHGLQATLPGSGTAGETVVYLASHGNPHELAALLEIAERFVTQRPRPAHTVVFLSSPSKRTALNGCSLLENAAQVIQPTGFETSDAASLVRDLNALQRQGK